MLKKIFIAFFLSIFVFIPQKALAITGETYVTITNPVRGPEGWRNLKQKPLDLPEILYKEASQSGVSSNWLLRYDAVTDATISAFFADLIGSDKLVSLGGFLEITPSLTKKINIYHQGSNGDYLSGYPPEQRLLLIDAFMSAFKTRFGFYPRFIGAWQLDSYSLNYLSTKYSVLTAMIMDDRYQENPRLFGGYLGSPYFPDKNNSLVPATSFANRINIAIVRWSQRDLFNYYNLQKLSLYSVQPSDYLQLGLSTKYFDNLFNQYSQKGLNKFTYFNTGLENDRVISDYEQEIKNIYIDIRSIKTKDHTTFTSLEKFGNWMISMYPETSPVYFYRTSDPAGNQKGEVVWYQSPYYRIGLKSQNGQTKIFDFRVYNRNIFEDSFDTVNQNPGVFQEIPALIDFAKYPGKEIILDIDLSNFKTVYDEKNDVWKIALESSNQKITFWEKTISFTKIILPTTKNKDIKETKTATDTLWTASPTTPFSNFFSNPIFPIALILVVIIICFTINKTFGIGSIISLISLVTLAKDGRLFPFGLGLWGSNAHDAIFHLSIIEKIAQNPFNLLHPQLAGEKLSNYHFVFDYLSGIIVRLTQIPSQQIYFFFFPLVITISLTFLIIKLLRIWKFQETAIILSLVFVFLGGSLGFIPSLIQGNSFFAGESVFWANQSISIFLNLPFALSLVFIVAILILIEKFKIKKSALTLISIILLGGLLAQTKIYAFILLLGGLLFSGQYLLLILIAIIGAAITIPFSSGIGVPFIFSPFWFIRSMFASSDRLNWERVANAWQVYEATGSTAKLLILNFIGIIIFYLGNLGTRLFGAKEILKSKNNLLSQKIFGFVALFGLLIPLIFIQRFNPWNSIQFIYYSLFVLGLFSGKGILASLAKTKPRLSRIIIFVIILIFTLLTTIGSIKDHTSFYSSGRVSYTELLALNTLKSMPQGVVIAPFYINSSVLTPKPLYAYASTAYISALSGKQEFLSDTINLDITGYNYQERAKDIQRFYNTEDENWAKSFLEENAIKYIYETPLVRLNIKPNSINLTKIFDSGEINIYQRN